MFIACLDKPWNKLLIQENKTVLVFFGETKQTEYILEEIYYGIWLIQLWIAR